MKIFLLAAVAAFSLSFFSTHDHQLCQGIIADEDVKGYVQAQGEEGNVSEEMFNHVLDRIEEVYDPIFREEYDATLVVERKWKSNTMNAYASRKGNKWIISMFGGLARHPQGTAGSILAVACHEIGHHIGGAPKKGRRWASDEGQSDYYATLKCLRKVFEGGWELGETYEVHPVAQEACTSAYNNNYDIEMCGQIAAMGETLAIVLGSFKKVEVSFETPATKEVNKTSSRHPQAQCRLDIYFNGAICNMPYDEELPQDDPRVGACWVDEGEEPGTRRRCWFQPKDFASL